MKIRKIVLWLHGWVGMALGLLLVVSGLSGSALIFRPQLEPALQSAMHVVPQARRASWQAILDSAQRAAPDEKIEHIFIAKNPELSHEVWTRGGDLLFYIDPYTARFLGSRVPQRDFFGWLAQLHIRLLRGETGHNVVGIGGVALLFLGLSGLWLWWPRGAFSKINWKRAFSMRWSTNWQGRAYEWHRVAGFFSSGLLLVIALSGTLLVWPQIVGFFGGEAAPKTQVAPASTRALPLDVLVARAEAAFPEGELRRISFPAKAGAPLVVRKKLPGEMHPNGMNAISLDPFRGKVLHVKDTRRADAPTRVMNLRYPLHIGEWGGWFSKGLHALAGLMPLGLFLSGAAVWLSRRRARSRRRSAPASTRGPKGASL